MASRPEIVYTTDMDPTSTGVPSLKHPLTLASKERYFCSLLFAQVARVIQVIQKGQSPLNHACLRAEGGVFILSVSCHSLNASLLTFRHINLIAQRAHAVESLTSFSNSAHLKLNLLSPHPSFLLSSLGSTYGDNFSYKDPGPGCNARHLDLLSSS